MISNTRFKIGWNAVLMILVLEERHSFLRAAENNEILQQRRAVGPYPPGIKIPNQNTINKSAVLIIFTHFLNNIKLKHI